MPMWLYGWYISREPEINVVGYLWGPLVVLAVGFVQEGAHGGGGAGIPVQMASDDTWGGYAESMHRKYRGRGAVIKMCDSNVNSYH